MGKEAKTNAMRILERAKVAYTAHEYPHEEGVAVDGVTVAASIGEDPACVYKTLVTQGNSKNYFVFVIPVAAELDVARQFFCETRTEFLRKNSPVLRSKSETRSLASTAPKMEGAVHVKGRVLAWGGAAFAAPPLAFCPWGSSYPSVASPASSAASWAATGSVYSDQP